MIPMFDEAEAALRQLRGGSVVAAITNEAPAAVVIALDALRRHRPGGSLQHISIDDEVRVQLAAQLWQLNPTIAWEIFG